MSTGKSDQKPDLTTVECWRDARKFANLIYFLTAKDEFNEDSHLSGMLRQQAVALMSKIAEGYHRREHENFMICLEEAKGALGQCISQFYIAYDQEYLNKEDLNDALSKGYTLGIHINSFLKDLQRRPENPTKKGAR